MILSDSLPWCENLQYMYYYFSGSQFPKDNSFFMLCIFTSFEISNKIRGKEKSHHLIPQISQSYILSILNVLEIYIYIYIYI